MNGLRKCYMYIQWNSVQPFKKKEILQYETPWVKLLRSQSQRDKCCMAPIS